MTSKHTQRHHAQRIISELLYRMAAKDRYSDDERTVTAGELQPLDVVTLTDKQGRKHFGTVNFVKSHAGVIIVCGIGISEMGVRQFLYHCESDNEPMRTIYETEGIEARQHLTALYAQGVR